MKNKVVHLIICLGIMPYVAFGQNTLIPDTAFEQALIDLGYDTGVPDGSVPTANISGIGILNVSTKGISDLTGITDFAALTELCCDYNQLTSLDVSNNTALTVLFCDDNQLTSLDVSSNLALTELGCYYNQLTSLDVRGNTALTKLTCFDNQLTCLNVKNGDNGILTTFNTTGNPSLTCIEVDDATWSTANWTGIDSQTSFSNNCGNACTTGINQHQTTLWSIYPNPIYDFFMIESDRRLLITLYNAQGEQLKIERDDWYAYI